MLLLPFLDRATRSGTLASIATPCARIRQLSVLHIRFAPHSSPTLDMRHQRRPCPEVLQFRPQGCGPTRQWGPSGQPLGRPWGMGYRPAGRWLSAVQGLPCDEGYGRPVLSVPRTLNHARLSGVEAWPSRAPGDRTSVRTFTVIRPPGVPTSQVRHDGLRRSDPPRGPSPSV
jgi:hypothetical protein